MRKKKTFNSKNQLRISLQINDWSNNMDTTFFNTVDMTCCMIVSITNTMFIMCQSQQVMLAVVKNVASLEAQPLACVCPTHTSFY